MLKWGVFRTQTGPDGNRQSVFVGDFTANSEGSAIVAAGCEDYDPAGIKPAMVRHKAVLTASEEYKRLKGDQLSFAERLQATVHNYRCQRGSEQNNDQLASAS